MSDTNEPEVDTSAFDAQIDKVVEAAANRDAKIAEIDEQYTAVIRKANLARDELHKQISELDKRKELAYQIRNRHVQAVDNEYSEVVTDDEPF